MMILMEGTLTKLRALPDRILATKGDFGEHVTKSGLIIRGTNGTNAGIVPRWFQVFEIGTNVKTIKQGQWILVEHGRWTSGINVDDDRLDKDDLVWQIDPNGILGVSDHKPDNLGLGHNATTAWS
jgi:hypothetical protein